ncbi:23076_t:CDS:1, partial [Gigaspora rosea]
TTDATINTLAELGIISTTQTVWHKKNEISNNHLTLINNNLDTFYESALVLNMDDYHNIHTNRVPNDSETSTASNMVTILLNPIRSVLPIPMNCDCGVIYYPSLVDTNLIKTELENWFIISLGTSFN